MVRLVTGNTSVLERDTAGDHHPVIDPAEAQGTENNRAQERGNRKDQSKGKSCGRRVKFEDAFPIQEVHRGDLKIEYVT